MTKNLIGKLCKMKLHKKEVPKSSSKKEKIKNETAKKP